MEPNETELYEERLRMIAYPSEEAIESAMLRMQERDFMGYILRAYLKKTAQWYNDEYPGLDRLPEGIVPGEDGPGSYSERDAKLLAWVVDQFDAELRHRIASDLQGDVRKCFETELRNHRQGELTGQHYCGPDTEAFVVRSST